MHATHVRLAVCVCECVCVCVRVGACWLCGEASDKGEAMGKRCVVGIG